MGATVAMPRVVPVRSQPKPPLSSPSPRSQTLPSRSQTPPPPVTQVPNRPTKKCHYLLIPCRKCHEELTISYPLSATFWKFTCTSCSLDYAIEIINNRKCLVFDLLGRRTVERIGLTNERSTYYRAKCYACGTVVIAAKADLGQVKSCHHCRLDFNFSQVHEEVFYETVVQHQGNPMIFRDKVQALDGYIVNKDNMFFLDEDIVEGSPRALVEAVRLLENELAILRDKNEVTKTTLLQLHAEKSDLSLKFKQLLEKTFGMTQQWQHHEQKLQVLEAEKRTYSERMRGYSELVQDLDQKTAAVQRLEGRVESLNRTILALTNDNQQLAGKLASQTELLAAAGHTRSKLAELQAANELLATEQERLKQKNRLLLERMDGYGDLQRNLERQSERATKFEAMYAEAATMVRKLENENHQLHSRLTGHGEVLRDLDRQTERVGQLDKRCQELLDKTAKLQEEKRLLVEQVQANRGVAQKLEQERQRSVELENANRDVTRKVERLVGENRLLSQCVQEQEARLAGLERQAQQANKTTTNQAEVKWRSLQQENERLAAKVREQAQWEARVKELESEIEALRQGGKSSRANERDEPKEDWYCEEGEEASISAHERGYQERRILGLKGEPTAERIKVALRRRIKKYHPDMVASMGVELRVLAHHKTQEITRAYTQLMQMVAQGPVR